MQEEVLHQVVIESPVGFCLTSAVAVDHRTGEREVGDVPDGRDPTIVGQVGRLLTDARPVDGVVLELEPQLALEHRVRDLKLADRQVQRLAADVVHINERILNTADLAALEEEEIEIVGELARERVAREDLQVVRRLEIDSACPVREHLCVGVEADGERKVGRQLEQLIAHVQRVAGGFLRAEAEPVSGKRLAEFGQRRHGVMAEAAAYLVLAREGRDEVGAHFVGARGEENDEDCDGRDVSRSARQCSVPGIRLDKGTVVHASVSPWSSTSLGFRNVTVARC